MAELYVVTPSAPRATAAADVLFVHGLGGDKFSTWQCSKSKESFWPGWLGADLPQVAVYSLGYDAQPSAWLGHALPLPDRATNVLALLEAEQLGQRPLIFVCHSLGGLLVKQLLRTAATLGQSSWQRFAENTKAVVFLATPHAGARLANCIGLLGRVLRPTAAVEDLSANDAHLRELAQWYSNNAQRLRIETRVYFETQDTAGVRIVDETSANPGISGVVPVPIDADHFSICKPADREALVYKSVRQFVSQFSTQKPASVASSFEDAGETAAASLPERPRKFFVSYRRRAQTDSRLANFLVARLREEGCEVFIDQAMPVGIDWSAEIDRRIDWCDYLVVLLSEESVASEMVQAEVRRAHHASKKEGRAKILPIRVNYTGALGYELDGHIGKLQYVLWQGEADDERIVGEILRASTQQGAFYALESPAAVSAPNVKPLERPEPRADMRLLREAVEVPGSALASDNPFYIRRDADTRVEEFAAGKARTLVIKGPSQTGKSSLLLRYLARCLAAGKKVAFIDLSTFGAVRSLSFTDFARQFADALMAELGCAGIEAPRIERALELTNFLSDRMLPRIDAPLVIAIDEADRAIGSAWQEDFYSAVRGWDANRTHPTKKASWGKLGLALVIATDPKMLIESGYTSPFNVSVPIALMPFPRAALDTFNASYKQMLSAEQLDRLYALLRGHPYLTPLAFYRLIWEESSFAELCDHAAEESGPFGDHLRAKLDRLYAARLHEAMREIVFNARVPNNDRRLFYRLEAAGLAREEAGRIGASNEVYARFFKAVL